MAALKQNEKSVSEEIRNKIKHIAFIMDGNGRWAQKRLLPRSQGHVEGLKTFTEIIKHCFNLGIENVTVYAFSTENWNRTAEEVGALMGLLEKNIDENAGELIEKGVRIIFLGDKTPLSKKLAEKMENLEKMSENNKAVLNVAVNYGARDEIVHAVNSLIKENKTEISAADISAHLYTKNSPDPDLIVRTAGEKRLSNFLLWQAAYSEFYYSDKLWPDFTPADVDEALDNFMSRHRKFGGY
ncbi:MAG: di-trans,poly-cis-decaprenylcistransferase [Ruminococcaceae bacterium]|nr:di-trans,poly-cis-decaprenylcistransferase [Oscillospiraceae bacterium]